MCVCVWGGSICMYEVGLDFKNVRHLDGQGRKNSVIIYYLPFILILIF